MLLLLTVTSFRAIFTNMFWADCPQYINGEGVGDADGIATISRQMTRNCHRN